jgi:hypothetical protein
LLLQLTITVQWTTGTGTKSMSLNTLFGDRKFGDLKVSGDARIDYGIQVQTSFVDSVGKSDLIAIGGVGESQIEQRLLSSANESINAGHLTLTQEADANNPSATTLATVDGVNVVYQAPPDQTPAASTATGQKVTHPNLLPPKDVAGIATTGTLASPAPTVAVSNQVPVAQGGFYYDASTSAPGSGLGNTGYFYVDNQADTSNTATLHLDSTRPVFRLAPTSTTPAQAMSGSTSAKATALTPTAQRGVFSTATVSLNNVRVLPVTFIPGSNSIRSVFGVDSFAATVTCNSTVNSGVAAQGDGSWSAAIRFWVDPANNGVTTDGSFQTVNLSATPSGVVVNSTGSGVTYRTGTTIQYNNAPFSQFRQDVSTYDPLVYDGSGTVVDPDVYLFQDSSHAKGYLVDWQTFAPSGSVDTAKQTTTGTLNGAMNIVTAPTNGTLPESGLNISLGKLSCLSQDKR